MQNITSESLNFICQSPLSSVAKTIVIVWKTNNKSNNFTYQMENINEVNFLSVTTNVTVSDWHSVVKINTDLMQIYLLLS